MTGAQARDFALVVRATLLVRAQEFADRLGARGRQIGGYGMSATPPAGAMSGSRRTGLASPGRSSSPRRLGSASSKRCRCSGQSATVAENTLIYGWLQVGGQWITYHRYNIGGKVINIGTYFDRRGVIRSGFEDRRLARRSCCSCSPDSCGSAACCPPRLHGFARKLTNRRRASII